MPALNGSKKRLFKVLVTGGMSLVTAGSFASVGAACSGGTTVTGDAGFPQEGPAQQDGFPSEGPVQIDTGTRDAPIDVATDVDSDASDASDASDDADGS